MVTRSIYSEMCKPSPLSKPPKPEPRMLTFEEALKEAQAAIRKIGTGAFAEELVKEGPRTYSRKVKR